jgi:hypothetical protein
MDFIVAPQDEEAQEKFTASKTLCVLCPEDPRDC